MTPVSPFAAFSLLSNGQVVLALCACKRDVAISPALIRLLLQGARELAHQEHPGAVVKVVLPWRLGNAFIFVEADDHHGDDEGLHFCVIEEPELNAALRDVLPETEALADRSESPVDGVLPKAEVCGGRDAEAKHEIH